MMKAPTVYVGWDSRADIAFQVARASIARRSSGPIKVHPLRLKHLSHFLTRPIELRSEPDGHSKLWCPISQAHMSTEFAISRFCVPFLHADIGGWALFTDCDIVCHSDIYELFALADDRYAAMVVKHRVKEQGSHAAGLKMDGQVQTYYTRKNWSSVVLWNCNHPANKRFTREHLNTWTGRDLHAFKWLNDEEIGELPQKWNWLINVTLGEPEEKGIWHYTLGGPWFNGWQSAKYDEAWLSEAAVPCFSH